MMGAGYLSGEVPQYDDDDFVTQDQFCKLQEAVMNLQAHLISHQEMVIRLLKKGEKTPP